MIERRFLVQELRVDKKGKQPVISGHAAVFNQRSEELWGFREVILPGAFAKSIKKDDIRALWNHDPNFVLGRNKSGTLTLEEDGKGLAVRIEPPDTAFVNDFFLETIRRGDVDQMSFGFRTVSDQWRMEDGGHIRELVEADLFDVSPVTFPAYPQTDVQARDFYEARMKIEPVSVPTVEENADSLAAAAEARAKNAVLRQQMNEKLYQYL